MQGVYRRRRIVAGAGALLVLWLLVQVLGALVGLVARGDGAAEAAGPTTTAAPEVSAPPTTDPPCPAGGTTVPPADEEPPDALVDSIDAALSNYGLTHYDTGASIWVEGYGTVAASNAELPLAPASNQKILTAMGVLELLDGDTRLETDVRVLGELTDDGVVHGDLVIVGGGDPLIKRTGPHSIEDIAAQLDEAGVTHIRGDVLGDESRYDQVRKAPGWLEWEMPLPAGTMSALMVNSNSRQGDAEYLANPTPHNAGLLLTALEERGIEVDGQAGVGTAPPGTQSVLTYPSPTIDSMVQTMLRESDNMTAEMLVKEVGLQVAGEGSSEAGMEAIVEALEQSLCMDIAGLDDDASGVSRDNRRTTSTWMQMLVAAQDEPWFDTFHEGLPVAGAEHGTLAGRFLGTSAAGDVQAKTGTIGTAVALSGYAQTEGDRDVAFSIVVNGDQPESDAVPALDAVVLAVQSDES
jgi:D-alanyl-D-alanine carboxypeptidase/D-alanyl-D-alanine-endopeptidase (penicillin-binding protein 4)